MAKQNSKRKNKRLSKGQRTHVRRLKQAARKEATMTTAQHSPAQPVRNLKKPDQSKRDDLKDSQGQKEK